MDNNHPIKVCYFGTYRKTYNRNQMMIASLRINGVKVVECHQTLWHGIEDRVNTTKGGWKQPIFWLRVFRVYTGLIVKYIKLEDYDVMIVGYPGQLDVILARILTWIRRKPLMWDILMSLYLIALDRGLDKNNQLSMKLLQIIEGFALKLPDRLILDTPNYVEWFIKNYRINPQRFRLLPIGADDRIFEPATDPLVDDNKFRVLYAGTFIPNHGVKYIIEAANALKDIPEIEFELIGEGPDLIQIMELVRTYKLNNVRFTNWLSKEELTKHIKKASVCLGSFGKTTQSLITVHNKIYESMAMAKPIINGDSSAVRQAFTHREQIYLCERENGRAIAEAILTLWKDPALRISISMKGHEAFIENYTLEKNGIQLKKYIRELIE